MAKVYLAFVEGGHAGLLNAKADPNATPGKETPYLKSIGRRVQEEEFNQPVAAMIRENLKRCGVHVYNTAPNVYDTPLKDRVDYANKIYYQYCSKYGTANVVAIFISIHFNALDGTFAGTNPSGFSVHIYKGQKGKAAGRLAQFVIEELQKGTKQVNRGIVEQDLFVTRTTVMPAILSENGFMDNEQEANLMLNKSFQNEVADEHSRGVCRYFGINYIPEVQIKEENEMLEKAIVVNSFADFPAAEPLAGRLAAPIYLRSIIEGKKVSKELYVVGGTSDKLLADKITLLSGADRYATAAAVKKFLG